MYTGDFGGNLNCSACSPLSSTQVIIYQSCGTELVCAGNLIETPLLATSLVEIGNTKEKNGLKIIDAILGIGLLEMFGYLLL
jgi:hypothetical protein